MLRIAGQTAGTIGLNFLWTLMAGGCHRLKQFKKKISTGNAEPFIYIYLFIFLYFVFSSFFLFLHLPSCSANFENKPDLEKRFKISSLGQ